MKILSEEFLIKLVCLLHNFKPLLLVAVKIIVMYLTKYAGEKVTIGVGHFQIIDFLYDW